LQGIFDNQYYLVFQAVPGRKDGLQRVNISTQVPNADVAAADNVWVPSGSRVRYGLGKQLRFKF
jgi:hypothetical protein